MSDLEVFAKSGVLPAIFTEHGEDDPMLDPAKEVIICDSISGGQDYLDGMPRRLSLMLRDHNGNEVRAVYSQVQHD